jgi:hypothetical protein
MIDTDKCEAELMLVDRFLAQSTAMPDDVFRRAVASIFAQPPAADGSEWIDPLNGQVWTWTQANGWTLKPAASHPGFAWSLPEAATETKAQQSNASAAPEKSKGRVFECACSKELDERDCIDGDLSRVRCFWCGTVAKTGWK